MSEELKPCPFCGGDAGVCEDEIERFFVYCKNWKYCLVRSPSTRLYGIRDEAIAAWNARIESDMLPQWIKNCLFDKMDDLRDIVDSPFVVPQIKGAVKAQIDMIEWMLTLRKPEEK